MSYVDGFAIPVPDGKVDEYRKIAQEPGKVWMRHGGLDYYECVGDDLRVRDPEGNMATPFPDMTKLKRNETVSFSFIIYKSRAHRDRVNKKVMADLRMAKMGPSTIPADMKRVAYGGFRAIVELHA